MEKPVNNPSKGRVEETVKSLKKSSRLIDKVSDLKPGEKTVGIMAKNINTNDVCKMLFDTSKAKPSDDNVVTKDGEGNVKNFSTSTIDPYLDKPRDDQEVIDLSNTIVTSKIVFIKLRFDDNYIFAIERVELEPNEYQISNYLAWSVKRCRQGENDEDWVPDKQGKLKKRFAFSGKISTLPELHEAVMNLCTTSQTETMISWEKAKSLEEDKFNCVDISTACRPIYSNKVYAFGGYRAYLDDVTYTNGTQHAITYKTLVLTKLRTEKSKGKSKNKDKYFVLHIPTRRMFHFLMAIELAMFVNNIKPKSTFYFAKSELETGQASDEDYTPSGDEADEEDSVDDKETETESRKRKRHESDENSDDERQHRRRKLRKAAIAPAYVDFSDTDDDNITPNKNNNNNNNNNNNDEVLDDDGEDDDPTPTVQEEEAEASDAKATQSDEDFVNDEPEPTTRPRKRKRALPSDSDSEEEMRKKSKKPKMTDAMLGQMYRRMLAQQNKNK
jgi:hypothetical protein